MDQTANSGIGNDAHRGLAVQGSTAVTTVLRNSPLFRVTTADADEEFPDDDGGEADALSFDGFQKCGDLRLRAGAHRLGDDVCVDQLGNVGSHSLSSSANDRGL